MVSDNNEPKGQDKEIEKNDGEQKKQDDNENIPPKERLAGSNFYKQKLAEAEAREAKVREELENERTEKLVQKENYKGLYELEKKKREEAEEREKKSTNAYYEDIKIQAVEREAIKAGILDIALEDVRSLDLDMIEVETTSRGHKNVIGAKEYVDNLKEVRPHWFNKMGAPRMNTGQPSEAPQPKELTPDELIKLQKKDPEKYKQEMKKRLNIA